jgi:aminoglycoside phosphotransferase family enzyme
MACVFLTVELAFKLKKPGSFGNSDRQPLVARAWLRAPFG